MGLEPGNQFFGLGERLIPKAKALGNDRDKLGAHTLIRKIAQEKLARTIIGEMNKVGNTKEVLPLFVL